MYLDSSVTHVPGLYRTSAQRSLKLTSDHRKLATLAYYLIRLQLSSRR
jgi:hypothetical protein